MSEHTPGFWSEPEYDNDTGPDDGYFEQWYESWTDENTSMAKFDREVDAKLAVASVNSYIRHCGSRAVECAENDLLGRALDALAAVVTDEDYDPCVPDNEGYCESHTLQPIEECGMALTRAVLRDAGRLTDTPNGETT